MSFYKEATGYIIHQRNFKDTSLIIEFFSMEYGLIHLIAKGIKKNKSLKPQLQFFHLLKIQFFGKSQLKTVTALNSIHSLVFNRLIDKTAALYLNELIHYSLIENEQSNALFKGYEKSLSLLGKHKLTPLLRNFEQLILKHNGFEIHIATIDQGDGWFGVDDNVGLIKTDNNSQKLCTAEDLHHFLKGDKLNAEAQKRINKMMMRLIDISVSFKRLFSRELLISLTK